MVKTRSIVSLVTAAALAVAVFGDDSVIRRDAPDVSRLLADDVSPGFSRFLSGQRRVEEGEMADEADAQATKTPAPKPTSAPPAPQTTAPAPLTTAPATMAPATIAPATTAPATTAPATTAPATTAPATTAPATTAPATTAPATTAPATTAPATTAPATTAPATTAPATTAPATTAPATTAPATTAPPTPGPTTSIPITTAPPTPAPPTPGPTTSIPITTAPPTPAPPTPGPTTSIPITTAPPTPAPPTPGPTTSIPITTAPPTPAPPTPGPTTSIPITTAPPTPAPPTPGPTTSIPITTAPPTPAPPTPGPTTSIPITTAPPTPAPPTPGPTTSIPITTAPPTPAPPTPGPTTSIPITTAPPTPAPPTPGPTTSIPITTAPPTNVPITTAPAPITTAPAPVTTAPAPVTTAPAPVTTAPAPVSTAPSPTSRPSPTPEPSATLPYVGTTSPPKAPTQPPVDLDSPAPLLPPRSNRPTTPPPSATTPTLLSVTTEPPVSSAPARIGRGDKQDVITIDGSQNGTTRYIIKPNGPAEVVGGKDTVKAETKTLSTSEHAAYKFLQYGGSAVTAVSLIMVAVFQFSGLITGMSSTSVAAAAAAPSCWEFGAFIGYVQSVSAIGHITARDVPAFLLTYGDTFSWTVFIPFHSDKSAIGRRRLSVVVLDGVIAFADRIGVKETDLLNRCVAGFLVMVGVLAAVLVIVLIYNKARQSRLDPANDPFSLAPQREQTDARNRLFVVAGVGVLLWLFALYPLSLMATFEIAEEIRAKEISSGPLTIAIVMLMLVVLGVFAVSVMVVYKLRTDQDMLRPKNRLVWGSLYMDVVYDRRLFFVVPVAVQILSGVVVGGFQGQTSQLVCLLALDIVLLLGIFVLRPFVKGSLAQWLAGISAFVRVLNTALAFAFISDSVDTKKSSSTRQIANALIAINTVVIIAWFLRHFGVLCRITRDRMQCMNDKKNEVGTPSTAGETTSSNQYARALLDQNQNSGGQV